MNDSIRRRSMKAKLIGAITPVPPFRTLLDAAMQRTEGWSAILLSQQETDLNEVWSWWRRGRVESSLFATNFGNPVGGRLIKASASVAQASPSTVES